MLSHDKELKTVLIVHNANSITSNTAYKFVPYKMFLFSFRSKDMALTVLRALAKASIATASLPGVLAASLLTASAINISELPVW